MPGSPVVQVEWLKKAINRGDIVTADCRYSLQDYSYGITSYRKGHIPGAVFFDLESDLADKSIQNRGRHPIPSIEKFREKLEGSGITQDSILVAYDDDGAAAARLWFLLKYYSFDRVLVLDGGIKRWTASGGEIVSTVTERPRSKLTLLERKDMTVGMEFVEKNLEKRILIDARSGDRYRGEVEPLDRIAGHIPGAINQFWKIILNDDSTYKSGEELSLAFEGLGKDPIIYCGSGVTSCVNYIAMLMAGLAPKVYPGGWSEWSSKERKGT